MAYTVNPFIGLPHPLWHVCRKAEHEPAAVTDAEEAVWVLFTPQVGFDRIVSTVIFYGVIRIHELAK